MFLKFGKELKCGFLKCMNQDNFYQVIRLQHMKNKHVLTLLLIEACKQLNLDKLCFQLQEQEEIDACFIYKNKQV